MKKGIAYFLFLLFCLCNKGVFSQPVKKDPAVAAIEKVMAMQEQSWNEGNIDKFMEGYWNSDSLTFVGKKGVTYGWKATLANYKKNYPDKETMGKLTFTLLKKEKLGPDSYLVIGKWYLQRTADEAGGYFSLTWKKMNGKWVIINDHTS